MIVPCFWKKKEGANVSQNYVMNFVAVRATVEMELCGMLVLRYKEFISKEEHPTRQYETTDFVLST